MATKKKEQEAKLVETEILEEDDDIQLPPQIVVSDGNKENGNAETKFIGHSSELADWEKEQFEAEGRGPNAQPIRSPQNVDPDPIEALTPEEADKIVSQLTEFDGRLPIEVKRRGEKPSIYYIRVPSTKISMEVELERKTALQKARKSGVLSTAEIINQSLYDMTPDKKQKVDEIEADTELSAVERHMQLMDLFLNTPLFSMVQDSADVYAQEIQNMALASHCVQKFVEVNDEKRWFPVWKTIDDFQEEDIDVTRSIILDMIEAQNKLQSARFLPLSSEEAESGPTSEKSVKSTE